MIIHQKHLKLRSYPRGFHLITDEVLRAIPEIKEITTGMLQVFIQHTSASLTLNENWDPTVRGDFERHINVMVPENARYYEHNYEGSDDMPAHIKASLMGSSVMIPIANGKLLTGTWQGIYLGEHRNADFGRSLVITAWGI